MKPTLLIFGFALGIGITPSYAPEVKVIEKEVFVIVNPPPIPNKGIPLTVPGDYEGHFK